MKKYSWTLLGNQQLIKALMFHENTCLYISIYIYWSIDIYIDKCSHGTSMLQYIYIYIYVLHKIWVNSWLSLFIHIKLLPSTLCDISMGWSIFDLRYSSYDMGLHGCIIDVCSYYLWSHLDATLVWDLPWYFGWEAWSTTEVEYDVAIMASCEAGWRSSLESC